MQNEENPNLAVWNKVAKTNTNFTKDFTGPGGYSGTSINGTAMIMAATELWGPIGLDWGYKILEERIDSGAHVTDEAGEIIGNNSTNTIYLELWVNKAILNEQWAPAYDGEDPVARVTNFGHTPYIQYNRKYKNFTTDGEASKKSLTDAIKKCLSMYGFSADIFLGLFDDVGYVGQLKAEEAMEEADDKMEEGIKQRQAYADWLVEIFKLVETSVSKNELEVIFKGAYRKMQRANDNDHLLKLTRAKDKRMKHFEEDKENGDKATVQHNEGHAGTAETSGSGTGSDGRSKGHNRGNAAGPAKKSGGDSQGNDQHETTPKRAGGGNKTNAATSKSRKKSGSKAE